MSELEKKEALHAGAVEIEKALKEYYHETDPMVLQKLEEWQNLKFGLLMHWAPSSQWGIVESWSLCSEDEDWCKRKIEDYTEYKHQYENLKKTFYPKEFDPAKWATAAEEAGMKYVIFTTKHHDGFCMYDSKYTNYKITDYDCPFHSHPKANITKEIFNEFRKKDFMVGTYFSKPDWHSDYFWWLRFATPDRNANYDLNKYPERWEKFVEFTQNQIDELMTDYGKIDILWLDGCWVRNYSEQDIEEEKKNVNYNNYRVQSQDIDMTGLVKKAREKQPGLIVVDRAVEGPYQNYLTPENQIPGKLLPYPWESCIIMGGGWSYAFNAKYRSAHELINMLVDIVSKGGNLLLNIAPSPEGTWDDEAYQRLKELGAWMKINDEAIYNTRPMSPYREEKICFTQLKDGTAYAIYLNDENEKTIPSEIKLPESVVGNKTSVALLGSKDKLKLEKIGTDYIIHVPQSLQNNPPCENAWVFKIK